MVFDINAQEETTPDLLLCEWGDRYCCLAAYNLDDQTIQALRYMHLPAGNNRENIEAVLTEAAAIGKGARQLVFAAAFPECILFPKKLYQPGNRALEAMYDAPFRKTSSPVNEWGLIAEFGIPETIYQGLQQRFPQTTILHAYASDLRRPANRTHTIDVHLTPNSFRVLVRSSGQLLLAQTYTYLAPLDLVYYLLKIRAELSLPVAETGVMLSGLVEKDSALYAELHQYFPELEFQGWERSSFPASQYPDHYFTHLENLAACAS